MLKTKHQTKISLLLISMVLSGILLPNYLMSHQAHATNISSSTPNATVTVPSHIAISVDQSEVIAQSISTGLMSGTFTATVTANTGYNISISANKDSSTSLTSTAGTQVIPTLSADGLIDRDTHAWGIRTCAGLSAETCTGNYLGVPAYGTTKNFYSTSTIPSSSISTLFQVGISVSPDLPSGDYGTTILVTASTK